MQSFVKIKSSQNGKITLSFTYESKLCHSCGFYVANMSFNAIRENKILAKISDFTVFKGDENTNLKNSKNHFPTQLHILYCPVSL